jgi:hypothetical protein
MDAKATKSVAWSMFLPYPMLWLRGLVLVYCLGYLIDINYRRYFLAILAILVASWVAVLFLFTFFNYLIAIAIEFTIAHLPDRVIGYKQIYKWLAARRSARNWSHWREGLNASSVTFVEFAVSLSVSLFLLPAPYGSATLDYYLLRRSLFLLRLSIMATIFFIVAAYLYQYDCWARQAAKSTKSTKVRSPQPRKPQPPVDPIEQ